MVPPSVLGGVDLDPTPHQSAPFIPSDPGMDREVRALHQLARRGAIPCDVAERQINMYLAAAAHRSLLREVPPRWLLLPITDTPHHSLLPDLGGFTHNILARTPIPGALSTVLEQSIPSLRNTQKPCPFQDYQDVLLNLVLALLLGLYPGNTVKRPDFLVRSHAFAKIHALLTASRLRQSLFCRANQPVIVVACMEYVARVLPVHMPAQAAYLTGRDPSSPLFFRRLPLLCDEFRQSLDSPEAVRWPQLRAACANLIDKVARLKKAGSVPANRDPHLNHPSNNNPPGGHAGTSVMQHWEAPKLHGTKLSGEYRLLAQALGLNEPLLRAIQNSVQIFALPPNLRALQEAALVRAGPGGTRSAYLSTRLMLCAHCIVAGKNVEQTRLRLNTLTQRLLCSCCGRDELISVDMLGRVLRHKQQFFVLCPSCTTIHPYTGEQLWHNAPCTHRTLQRRPKVQPKARHPCTICSEPTTMPPIERVDHLQGVMREFFFCQRHAPRPDALRHCKNARQLEEQCA